MPHSSKVGGPGGAGVTPGVGINGEGVGLRPGGPGVAPGVGLNVGDVGRGVWGDVGLGVRGTGGVGETKRSLFADPRTFEICVNFTSCNSFEETSAGFRDGCRPSSTAAAPATCGHAMEVPSFWIEPDVDGQDVGEHPKLADVIALPGANILTHSP